MSVLKIPIWPEDGEDLPMTFLEGEPGWYLWMQHKFAPELNQVERDLMLLYNNGDLKDFPAELNTESGIYVCTFTENKVIRGLVLNKFKNVSPEEGSVVLLDVDSGKVLTVPKSNLKVIPTFACKAPARAVRCDLGLDCKERCDWPPLLDEMLKRVLSDAQILVTLESERPGTVPTVSVTARLWNPAANSAIDLRVWFAQHFRPLLEISSLNSYLPEPVFNNNSDPARELKLEESPGPSYGLSLPQANPWNPFLQNTAMLPLLNAPPGFAQPNYIAQALNMNSLLLNLAQLGYRLPPTPIWNNPNMSGENYPSTDMNFSPPPQYFQQFSPLPFPQSLSSSEPSSLHSLAPPSPPCPQPPPVLQPVRQPIPQPIPQPVLQQVPQSTPFPKVAKQRTPKTFNSEDRSNSPVLTLESLLEGSPTLKRKPMEKEATTPLTVDTVLGSPSNADATPKPVPRRSRPTKEEARATMSLNNETIGHNCVELREIERNWSVGDVVHVILSNVVSPELFVANVVDCHAPEFNRLEREMYDYSGSLPLSVSSKEEMFAIVGDFCAAYDDEDKMWFRAEILDWHFDEPKRLMQAWSVDYGGMFEVPMTKIRRLEGYSAQVPIQGTLFGMHNVRPRREVFESEWPEGDVAEVRKMMPVDGQFWLQIEKPPEDAVWPVSVFGDRGCQRPSLNTILVDRKLAFYHNSMPAINQPSMKALSTPREWDPMRDDFERLGHDYKYDDEDACVAVSGGFKPRDVKNVCRFYLERGSCPKGLNCRQRHVNTRNGGLAQEEEMVYGSAFNDLELPSEGSVFTLKITKIVNVHHFFGIRIPDKVSSKEEHFKMLMEQINSPEEVKKLEVCRSAPAFGQLVLARIKGFWFRGRVIDVAHDCEDRFEVLNVDTGTLKGVELRDLREMNPAFLHLPFQAIECFLADVVPVSKGIEFTKEGVALVDKFVRDETVQAFVVDKNLQDALEVMITVNYNGAKEDLGKILIQRGFVRAAPIRTPSQEVPRKKVLKYLPG